MSIPWDQPATVIRYKFGLQPEEAFKGTLKEAVIHALTMPNPDGDGHRVRLDDDTDIWQGPEIQELGRQIEE